MPDRIDDLTLMLVERFYTYQQDQENGTPCDMICGVWIHEAFFPRREDRPRYIEVRATAHRRPNATFVKFGLHLPEDVFREKLSFQDANAKEWRPMYPAASDWVKRFYAKWTRQSPPIRLWVSVKEISKETYEAAQY